MQFKRLLECVSTYIAQYKLHYASVRIKRRAVVYAKFEAEARKIFTFAFSKRKETSHFNTLK